MPSFQSMVFDRSSSGWPAEMPSGLAPAAMRAILSNSSAAWISALEGMQPTLRQVPPSFFASTIDRVDAKLARSDGADIAARPRTDHQQPAGNIFHGLSLP